MITTSYYYPTTTPCRRRYKNDLLIKLLTGLLPLGEISRVPSPCPPSGRATEGSDVGRLGHCPRNLCTSQLIYDCVIPRARISLALTPSLFTTKNRRDCNQQQVKIQGLNTRCDEQPNAKLASVVPRPGVEPGPVMVCYFHPVS